MRKTGTAMFKKWFFDYSLKDSARIMQSTTFATLQIRYHTLWRSNLEKKEQDATLGFPIKEEKYKHDFCHKIFNFWATPKVWEEFNFLYNWFNISPWNLNVTLENVKILWVFLWEDIILWYKIQICIQ